MPSTTALTASPAGCRLCLTSAFSFSESFLALRITSPEPCATASRIARSTGSGMIGQDKNPITITSGAFSPPRAARAHAVVWLLVPYFS